MMIFPTTIVVLWLQLCLLIPSEQQASPTDSQKPVRYIVGWAPKSSEDEIKMSTLSSLADAFGEFGIQSHDQLDLGFDGFRATAFELTPEAAKKLDAANTTIWVEPEMEMRALQVQQLADSKLLYNLDMLDGMMDGTFQFSGNRGAGCNIFVLDTGINTEHVALKGRAQLFADVSGQNKASESGPAGDIQGHGSHVAGTAGGKAVGVATDSNLLMIRVLQDSGKGSTTAVTRGIQLAVQEIQKTGTPGVINMSLGGAKSRAVDAAVSQAVAMGIPIVVAAGNESQDACNTSPGGTPGVISVGAVDQKFQMAKFSNFGNCVTLFAPGVQIISSNSKNSGNFRASSGTSMASPLVAGAACLLMSNGVSIKNVGQELVRLSVPGVQGNIRGSPNRLLSLASMAGAPAQVPGTIPAAPGPIVTGPSPVIAPPPVGVPGPDLIP